MNSKSTYPIPRTYSRGVPVYDASCHPVFDFSEYGVVGRKRKYINTFVTFDIETSTVSKDLNFMYIWQLCVSGDYVIVGRRWDEFRRVVLELSESVNNRGILPCYVHNLAYEFQYLRGVFDFGASDVFLLDSRKPAKATIPGTSIELRCSYKLSNRSLGEWTDALGVRHGKLEGDLDYAIIRTPTTELTPTEFDYCVNDVVGLHECIIKLCEQEGVNMATIPLTATGFVRRECKKALKPVASAVRRLIPCRDALDLMLKTMRGGDTHCSRYYSGVIVEDVHCFDISSSYPFTMTALLFPMGEFRPVCVTAKRFLKMVRSRATPILSRIVLTEIDQINPRWGFPYLARAKCKVRDGVFDNGRILSAGRVETCVTDIDMRILLDQYTWDGIEVVECWVSRYGQLPSQYRSQIIKYYYGKTRLKGDADNEVEYAKSKNRINSVYGMTVQNPLKPECIYEGGEYVDKNNEDERFSEYSKKGWLPYQWGVWVCAHARNLLQEALKAIRDCAIYCDTDSVFFEGDVDVFDAINEWRRARSAQVGAFAPDVEDSVHYMGVFEPDKFCRRFVSWGAKKYAYEKASGELVITIAGVGKLQGAKELERAGGISVFKPGYVFREAAGNCWYYNDDPTHDIDYEGERITVTPNVAALPTTYEVSISDDYARVLNDIIFIRMHDIKNM